MQGGGMEIIMSITVEKVKYEPWGSCIRISNGKHELFATLDIGPRIIRYGIAGKHNIFFEDVNKECFVDLSDKHYFDDDTWYNYGGHRLWVSPELCPQCYYPENQPIAYETTASGVILTPPPQKFTNLQMQVSVEMAEDGSVTVHNKVTNIGAWPIKIASWGLSVLNAGGTEIIPQTTRDTGLLSNRLLALWPYADMSDERVTWGKKYIMLRQDKNNENKFKLGSTNEKGYAAYLLKDYLFIKQFDFVKDGEYPDGGMNFETFTNNYFLEMEALGTLKEIANGESVCHTERWNIIDEVAPFELSEDEIERNIEKYVR